MTNNTRQFEDEKIDALLIAHFSQLRHDFIPDEKGLAMILSAMQHGKTMQRIRSPYVFSLFSSYAAQRFALTFASLLIMVGGAAGMLETEAFSGNVATLPSKIPVMKEALTLQMEEMLSQHEHASDDEDFAAPESEVDPSLKSYDMYGEVSS